MMLVHFKDTFPFRVSEWFLSLVMGGWALVLLNPAFDPDQHALGGTLFQFVPYVALAYGCFVVSLLRFTALGINGFWWRTPFIRLGMAFLANFIWCLVTLGLIASGKMVTGLAVYPAFILLEFYNAFRAAHDARLSYSAARGSKGGRS